MIKRWAAAQERIVIGRIPRLPAATAFNLLSSPDPIGVLRDLLRDPQILAALYVASPSLTNAVSEWLGGKKPRNARTASKALAYILRMSSRCTPYGLFSSVSDVVLSDATTLSVVDEVALRTRTRPDMAWLMGFVRNVENNGSYRGDMNVALNALILERAGRIFVTAPDKHGFSQEGSVVGIEYATISLKKTAAIEYLFDLLKRERRIDDLVDGLMARFGAAREESMTLVGRLLDAGILQAIFRPAPIGDPASHVANSLPASAAAERISIVGVMDSLRRLDEIPVPQRSVADFRRVEEHMAQFVPHVPPYQIDAAHSFKGSIATEICAEAASLVDIWARSCLKTGLSAYRERFFQMYPASEIRIPLLEITDRDFGLGAPDHAEPIERIEPLRSSELMRVAMLACAERRIETVLEWPDLERIIGRPRREDELPHSAEVGFAIEAHSLDDIEAGRFKIIPAGLPVTHAAGSSVGRFADLLGEGVTGRMRERARRLSADAKYLHAELIYPPAQDRFANVSVRPAIYNDEIRLGVSGRSDGTRLVPLEDLLVGVRDDRFVTWNRVDGREVRVHETHMLNATVSAPADCRLLIEQGRDGRVFPNGFNWGEAASLPFLPRLRHGRLIISRARWNIGRERTGKTVESLRKEINRYQMFFCLPDRAALVDVDNRLPLNLASDVFLQLLLDHLPRNGDVIVLEEMCEAENVAWLAGERGSYFSEFLVSVEPIIEKKHTVVPVARDRDRCHEPTRRVFAPGSEWSYLKVYCGAGRCDAVLRDDVRPLVDRLRRDGMLDRWFFLRYRDPLPHIRLRFCSEARILDQLALQAESWLRDGDIESYAFDTYHREIERYGGGATFAEIENVFDHDSNVCLSALTIRFETPRERLLRTMEGILPYFTAFYADRHEGWLSFQQRPRRKMTSDERAIIRFCQERIIGGTTVPSDPILRVASLARNGMLTVSREELVASLLHMHCNRMGVLGSDERQLLDILWHAYNGIERRVHLAE